MDYVEVSLTISPFSQMHAEIGMALLAEVGFESFSDTQGGLLAYIPSNVYSQSTLNEIATGMAAQGISVEYTSTHIPDQNWNRRWESNFDPISIGTHCHIRAPFHPVSEGFMVEVEIEPRMAFGTGHHQTTWLMARTLFDLGVEGKSLLDMGCGTGVLAIIAAKLGAKTVAAIDIDHWAYENTLDNARVNGCPQVEVALGGAEQLRGRNFDIILANINLNVLTADMEQYAKALNPNGLLVLSGFYTHNVPAIERVALRFGLSKKASDERDGWALLICSRT